ncbi:MAG: hypothetical protein OXB92_01765 [Acidimicrobiaceae bacterium]|nr:hypothetical protein [Acidimicrobiaceae bacterium]
MPDDLLVQARSALLDAFETLAQHRDSVIVIGAQAVYLRAQNVSVAVAEATKDSDIVVDPRSLGDSPLIQDAMESGGFYRDPKNQPGAWLSAAGIPVDLMVPEKLAGEGSRGARIPPHDKHAARRARGLESAVVDNDWMVVAALDPADERSFEARVASSAALLVAKAHKIHERATDAPERLVDKDAHDIYRLLVATPTETLSSGIAHLLVDELAGETTIQAVDFLRDDFAAGPTALGSMMAGRTEEGIGAPETVALQASILASDLLKALG